MRLLALALAAAAFSGCRPWCAVPAELWDPAAYGPEAGAIAATDAFIAAQLALGRDRPAAELDAAARAVGAEDAAELAALARAECLPSRALARFARARGLTTAAARRYAAERFGVGACAVR